MELLIINVLSMIITLSFYRGRYKITTISCTINDTLLLLKSVCRAEHCRNVPFTHHTQVVCTITDVFIVIVLFVVLGSINPDG